MKWRKNISQNMYYNKTIFLNISLKITLFTPEWMGQKPFHFSVKIFSLRLFCSFEMPRNIFLFHPNRFVNRVLVNHKSKNLELTLVSQDTASKSIKY